jgi:energy-coupling factor transport system ATP-binding protein
MPITFEKVSYVYSEGTPFRYAALTDVDLSFNVGKMTAIIGQTGSGKSTLVQHLNALLLPTSGKVTVLDYEIIAGKETKGLKNLRGKVGLVFQFPEYQLFEETVLKDVAFGPKNFGVSEEEAIKKAKNALRMVGLEESYDERSPLELSGGQKRRVAIAGILAMNPEVIVLDEPTAGLDPLGTVSMMKLFKELNTKYNKTILIVTHDMEQVYAYCDEAVVMENSRVKVHTTVNEFFKNPEECEKLHILPPAIIRMRKLLNENGFNIDETVMDTKSLAKAIAKEVKHHG